MQTEDDGKQAALKVAAQQRLATAVTKLHAAEGVSPEHVDQIRLEVMVARANLDRLGKGGGKLSRSETVTVRLDPKLRYLAELAGRLHRRTLSSYIEWAIKEALDGELLRPTHLRGLDAGDHSIGNEAEYLWDVDEADRFAKLALRYPHLLTHDEQVRWKLIRECPGLWNRVPGRDGDWEWTVDEASLDFRNLRRYWTALCAKAAEDPSGDALPAWLTDLSGPDFHPVESSHNDEPPF